MNSKETGRAAFENWREFIASMRDLAGVLPEILLVSPIAHEQPAATFRMPRLK